MDPEDGGTYEPSYATPDVPPLVASSSYVYETDAQPYVEARPLADLLERGRDFLSQQRRIFIGEGPKPLRALCFLGGVAMFLTSVLGTINVFSILRSPSSYVLQLYQGLFGLVTMAVEAKDQRYLEAWKPWMLRWFKFLAVPGGKGVFYLFTGSLGLSLWPTNLLAAAVGLYMAALGCVCIMVHCGMRQQTVCGGMVALEEADELTAGLQEGEGEEVRPTVAADWRAYYSSSAPYRKEERKGGLSRGTTTSTAVYEAEGGIEEVSTSPSLAFVPNVMR